MGRVSSFQSLGTLDGPGIRYVVFLQGCPLRCGYCHNPETHDVNGGDEFTADEIIQRVVKYREYFGAQGGITLSGGEPLMQTDFAVEIFKKAKERGINTCLDTSGCIFGDKVKELLSFTDYCMLDIKFADDELYKKHIGCSIETPLKFLDYLNTQGIPTRIRQVIVPGINDNEEALDILYEIIKDKNIHKVELLPFKKLCQTKYDSMGKEFPFGNITSANVKKVTQMQEKINNRKNKETVR